MTELKPCPFCGDSWIYASTGGYGSGYEKYGYKAQCRCKGSFFKIDWQETKEQAIEAWNRRATE